MSVLSNDGRLFLLCIVFISFITSSSGTIPHACSKDIKCPHEWPPENKCPRNDFSDRLSFHPCSDKACSLMKLCNWSSPTVVTTILTGVDIRCCATGYQSLEWEFARSETPSNFTSLCPKRTNNQTSFRIIKVFYHRFDGIYRCSISKSPTGPFLHYDQRLMTLPWKNEGPDGSARLDSSWPSETVFTANKQGRKDIICTVDWNILSSSPVRLVIETTTSNLVLVHCTFYPICDAVSWETGKALNRCVVTKDRFPGHFNFSFELKPKIEIHLKVYRLKRTEQFRISVTDRNKTDQRLFTIRPVLSREASVYLIFFCSLITVLVISSAITAVFFRRDVRLAVHRRLFDYAEPVTPDACPLLVLYDHSRTNGGWNAEQLFDYLRREVGHRFNVRSEHLPGANVAGCLTRVPICVVVLDFRSLLNEQFAGHMKQLLLEKDSHRVYVLLEPFSQMQQQVLSHTLFATNVEKEKIVELLKRIKLDTRHRELISLSVVQKIGLTRPTWWIFRQVRLSIEIIRCQVVRLQANPADLTVNV